MEITIIIGTIIVIVVVVGCFVALLFSCICLSMGKNENLKLEEEIINSVLIRSERKKVDLDTIETHLVEI